MFNCGIMPNPICILQMKTEKNMSVTYPPSYIYFAMEVATIMSENIIFISVALMDFFLLLIFLFLVLMFCCPAKKSRERQQQQQQHV